MSCQIVPPAITCAYLDKASILELQQAIAAHCSFFNYVFPVAEAGQRPGNEEGKFIKYPRLFVPGEKNLYADLSPESDKFGRHSYCFFEVENKSRVEYVLLSGEIKFRLNLIGWLKMDDITQDKRDVTDYAAVLAKKAIMESGMGAFVTGIYIERDKMKVFDKYDYSFDLLRNIAWPYSCFKLVMDIQIVDQSECIDASCINPV